ncbi:MAG: sulfite exporter TauE/SafE family protein [Deltaproteobacteria bacterium]|nr:MAG: sulfite exporter TauE/SafE family protein [Deltaproteobacteria bacterium]
MNLAFLIVGAIFLGLVLGLFGSGGSLLSLPLMMHWMGLEPKVAVASSLLLTGLISVAGVLVPLRRKELCFKNAMTFLFASLPMSYLGALLGRRIDSKVQIISFSILMFLAGIKLLVQKSEKEQVSHCNPRFLPLLLIGAVIGSLTGLVGVGGGFMIVPALVLFGGISFPMATGTSFLLVAANSLIGFMTYQSSLEIPVVSILGLASLAIPFSWMASHFGRRLSSKGMQRSFGVGLLVISFLMIFKVLGIFI